MMCQNKFWQWLYKYQNNYNQEKNKYSFHKSPPKGEKLDYKRW